MNDKKINFVNLGCRLNIYEGEVIKDYFTTGERWGVRINYIDDRKPLGTAGSVKKIEEIIPGPFLLFYGDTMVDINLFELITQWPRDGLAGPCSE